MEAWTSNTNRKSLIKTITNEDGLQVRTAGMDKKEKALMKRLDAIMCTISNRIDQVTKQGKNEEKLAQLRAREAIDGFKVAQDH